jgi:dipeptidyl aminopeptidase/acylaminoacyl peptidase
LQPYSVRIPEGFDPAKEYPLLVFLHGSDRDDTALANHRSYVSTDHFIVAAPFGRGTTNLYTKDHAQLDIEEAIQDACRHFPIDTGKLVLAGFSMGGYGVLRTHYENPGRFKALAIFSGIPNSANQYFPGEGHPDFLQDAYLEPFKDVPLFVSHGATDRNAPFELAEQVVEGLRRAGAQVEFFVQEGVGHEIPRGEGLHAYHAWLAWVLSD